MSMYPELDAKRMLRPVLRNYDEHVLRFVDLLETLSCELYYEGPADFRDHVRDKTVYACSVRIYATSTVNAKKKFKSLKNIFPVMIGSSLDWCVRKRGHRGTFTREVLTAARGKFLKLADGGEGFHPADVAASFFLVNGCVRQLPHFFTNDPTNAHVVRGRKLVRCYTYDRDDRGKEMTYYAEREESSSTGEEKKRRHYERGDVEVVLNDGTALLNREEGFFDHCPHPTEQAAYMDKVYRDGRFDIDHLANKVVVSPGHFFVKLFVKYFYRPLKKREWSVLKSKHAMVLRSIQTGTLLHVLSKKTVYFRDPPSTLTVLNSSRRSGTPSSAVGGSANDGRSPAGDTYVEKNTGCYREVSMQTYPLNPYMSHLITRQMSSKVKKSDAVPFHPSYLGFLCLVGTFEIKNVGRTGIMVRDTAVSTREDADAVYAFLDLKPEPPLPRTATEKEKKRRRYAVVNEACVPVTRACFERVRDSLPELKRKFRLVECYGDGNFVSIRYKTGLFFKKIYYFEKEDGGGSTRTLWVTARDEPYWKRVFGSGRVRPAGYDRRTSYLADLNPFFKHNVFTKNILAYNTLKSAVLSTTPVYSEYFLETLSAYAPVSPFHAPVCRPADSFSARFALLAPLLNVAYASFGGLNQEDCIAIRRDATRAFDCSRFHTIRLKFEPPCRLVSFRPTRGDPDPECFSVGHLVFHGDASGGGDSEKKKTKTAEFAAVPQTMHVRLRRVRKDLPVYEVLFHKAGFVVRSHELSDRRLSVCLERFHACDTGDKLSSFHGQKGVVRIADATPVFGRETDAFGNVSTTSVHLLVNPYCLMRLTLGQFREGQYRGGADHRVLWNAEGRRVPALGPYGIFVAPTLYFGVNYLASEHVYAPLRCTLDGITGQPLRGRSRMGGMRLGNMEILNGMRGNGLAACFEEKVLEHSDRMFCREGGESPAKRKKNDGRETGVARKKKKKYELTAPLPKSVPLCVEDVKFYKCSIRYNVKPYFLEEGEEEEEDE